MPFFSKKYILKYKKLISFLFIFLTTLCIFFFLNKIKIIHNFTTSIQSYFVERAFGVHNISRAIFTPEESKIAQIAHYQDLASNIILDEVQLKNLQREVEELKTILAYKTHQNVDFTIAKIIARSPDDYQQIIIDKGEKDGINIGFAVTVQDGHLIGQVESVGENQAIVQLIQNANSKFDVTTTVEQKTIGITQGQNGFLLKMKYIPQDILIQPSDIVVTSGLESYIPKGLVIGIVDSVSKNETSNFQEALIEPLYQPTDFTYVSVINPLN